MTPNMKACNQRDSCKEAYARFSIDPHGQFAMGDARLSLWACWAKHPLQCAGSPDCDQPGCPAAEQAGRQVCSTWVMQPMTMRSSPVTPSIAFSSVSYVAERKDDLR